MDQKHTVFITGAAGYVGAMLVKHFANRTDVARVIGLDKEPLPDFLKGEEKLTYLDMNTADDWEPVVGSSTPDIVIHAAWQIRELYGKPELEWKWNIEGSEKVFRFALTQPYVKRLIHFSTVASYGAFSDNTIEHRFTEGEPFRKSEYLYAEEKRIAETRLEDAWKKRINGASVAIVRPAAITGPRGRFMRIRFGLQAALAGQLKDSFAYRLVSSLVSFVPITKNWCRQFIHEDDVVGIVERLSFGEEVKGYEVFNICPEGAVVRGADMAKAVGKKTLPIHPWLIRIAFFIFWHLTRGKIPTGKGAWRGYSYPIAVDGSKVTKLLGYHYRMNSFDAFYYTNGTYEEFVPEISRRHKN
jgi:nucleoside-diphosphate-sugar epimerase